MPRGLSASQIAAIAERVASVGYLVQLELVSGTIRCWSGTGELSALSNTWLGVGEYGVIDGIESDVAIKEQSIALGLMGLPGDSVTPSMISQTREERYQGRPLTIYVAFFDPNSGALIGDPLAVWAGVADVMSFRVGDTVSVSLTGEHFSSHLRRANGLRMTSESHNMRLGNTTPKDLFYEPQNRLMGLATPQL